MLLVGLGDWDYDVDADVEGGFAVALVLVLGDAAGGIELGEDVGFGEVGVWLLVEPIVATVHEALGADGDLFIGSSYDFGHIRVVAPG